MPTIWARGGKRHGRGRAGCSTGPDSACRRSASQSQEHRHPAAPHPLARPPPNPPAVDVYLYSSSSPHATLVLHHGAYGTVSPYTKVAAGAYTVAMRGAGVSPSSPPVLSTTVQVAAGAAYTVAGMGPA